MKKVWILAGLLALLLLLLVTPSSGKSVTSATFAGGAEINYLNIVRAVESIVGVDVDPADVQTDEQVHLILMRGDGAREFMKRNGFTGEVTGEAVYLKYFEGDDVRHGFLVMCSPSVPSKPGEDDAIVAGVFHFRIIGGATANNLAAKIEGTNVYLDIEHKELVYLSFPKI